MNMEVILLNYWIENQSLSERVVCCLAVQSKNHVLTSLFSVSVFHKEVRVSNTLNQDERDSSLQQQHTNLSI